MLDYKIPTLIVEKDRSSLNETVAILEKFSELSFVGKATSASQGFVLGDDYLPALVFVNVDLPDMSGIEFVRSIRKRNIQAGVVFLANDERFVFDTLPLEPFDYFVKPLDDQLIYKMIARGKMEIKRRELIRRMDVFTKSEEVALKRVFEQKKGVVILALDEIVFCKAERSSSSLKLCNGENVLLKWGINHTLETINNSDFIRVGRSYFINCNYLRKIDKKNLKCTLYFYGRAWEVPISKNTVVLLEKMNVQFIR